MIHIALHFIVPLLLALLFYRSRWRKATLIMIATMLVDVDHLLADTIYDPNRCSIGFHPLHQTEWILVYVVLFALPLFILRGAQRGRVACVLPVVQLVGLGLLVHMALDGIDCVT